MYLITIQNLFNAYNEKWKKKPSCHIACKDGQFDVVEPMTNNQFNLNAQQSTCQWHDSFWFTHGMQLYKYLLHNK